ncbi:ABC transporter permease [Niallia circulans]|uniref:ABC transporter permease n=1 Tax=Niallia circulans TaxID=1397 RepID=UPI00077C980D|nr:ABC transporter permease [Niallia circulans]MDR4316361.1 ABC transporter permease [Niallia circulans]MED3838468.1 ABC transporter permease [Niallia circulans]MED4243941.1 ABC transporter permease [Niallia circulans]MED4246335.1 ABC transporter permease [Niallia circulans]
MQEVGILPIIEDEELKERRKKRITLIGQVLIGILFFVLWELLTKWKIIDSYYWSSPTIIWETGIIAFTEGTLWSDLLYTSGATIIGFLFGTFFGALLGLSFWWSYFYSRITEPYLIAFNAIPKLALAPVLVILFGIGFSSKVVLAFMMTVIVTAIAAHSGVKSVDADLEKMLFSLGAKKHHIFAKVVIPFAMPWIVSSLKINIALALAGTIVGEFISSRQGIGRMILYAGQIMNINLVWVGVVVLSILSVLMYIGTVWLEKRLLKGKRLRE